MRSRNFRSDTEIVVIAHNIRSILNVGSILRSAEGFGVKQIYASGWTPSPDHGLPHVQAKLAKEIHKTALGAENIVSFQHKDNLLDLIGRLRSEGFRIVGLEQDARSISLNDYKSTKKLALLLGEEVDGIAPELRDKCDDLIEIPMFGSKESFNVSVATGIALYQLTR